MHGRYHGFINHLKRVIPEVRDNCKLQLTVIYRQHLVAKNLSDRLHLSFEFVINSVNKIRSNALSTSLFAQVYDENDEDFQRLLLHTDWCWLSKGVRLKSFDSLFESAFWKVRSTFKRKPYQFEVRRIDRFLPKFSLH